MVKAGEAFTELLGEDVAPGARPLAQLDEGGSRTLSHPQESIQPVGCPAGGHKGQREEDEEGTKFEEQHKCTKAEAEEEYQFVDLDLC